MCAKHYENPTVLSQVTAKNVRDVFFETHGKSLLSIGIGITMMFPSFKYVAFFHIVIHVSNWTALTDSAMHEQEGTIQLSAAVNCPIIVPSCWCIAEYINAAQVNTLWVVHIADGLAIHVTRWHMTKANKFYEKY